jgi:predicted phosphodiesterase
MTDRGSPIEARVVRRVVRAGHPFVFVSGNHDSDTLESTLASRGAIVLTEFGRLMPDGSHGPMSVTVGGMKIAGYSDPYERRSADDFKDRYDNNPTPEMQDRFRAWALGEIGKVDVIMVHEPALIEPTLAVLHDKAPPKPIVFVVGHTHHASAEHSPGVSVINGGSVGAGGTGNLTEHTPIGIARMTYAIKPRFVPLAADLVSIDPGTGSATAQRVRLDAGVTTPSGQSR